LAVAVAVDAEASLSTARISILDDERGTLQDGNFQFFFLGGLLGFGNITTPGITTTMTGEDFSSSGP
jgi:hypothetical protein